MYNIIKGIVYLFVNDRYCLRRVVDYLDELSLQNLSEATHYPFLGNADYVTSITAKAISRVNAHVRNTLEARKYIDNRRLDIVLHKYTTDRNFIKLKSYLNKNNITICSLQSTEDLSHSNILLQIGRVSDLSIYEILYRCVKYVRPKLVEKYKHTRENWIYSNHNKRLEYQLSIYSNRYTVEFMREYVEFSNMIGSCPERKLTLYENGVFEQYEDSIKSIEYRYGLSISVIY